MHSDCYENSLKLRAHSLTDRTLPCGIHYTFTVHTVWLTVENAVSGGFKVVDLEHVRHNSHASTAEHVATCLPGRVPSWTSPATGQSRMKEASTHTIPLLPKHSRFS